MKKVYTINSIDSVSDTKLHAQVSIDKGHNVFEGHFPEKSVLPGVIELEIIKAVVSQFFNQDYRLQSIKNAKYLGMILPDEVNEFRVDVDYKKDDDSLTVKALIFHEDKKFLKFSGKFSSND